MTGRGLVTVLLDVSVLTGEQHPRPRVGEIAAYGLSFREATEYTDPADPTLVSVIARVEPLRGGRPRRGRGWDGREHGRPRWSSQLYGDGWSALWTSFAPPPSGERPVPLRGYLISDFAALTSGRIRGRIRRLWTVRARWDAAAVPDDPRTWEPAWGSTELVQVGEQPMASDPRPWPALADGVHRVGLLAELDLDDSGPVTP